MGDRIDAPLDAKLAAAARIAAVERLGAERARILGKYWNEPQPIAAARSAAAR